MKSSPTTPAARPPFGAQSSTLEVRRAKSDVRHSLAVASRAVAAILGGYALAASGSVALTLASSSPREDAIDTATAISFLLYAAAIIWAFAARTAWHAWLGIALPAIFCAALAWWLLDSVSR